MVPRRPSSGLSLETHRAASVCLAQGHLTWRVVCSDSLVLEGHGLHRRALKDVLVGSLGAVITYAEGERRIAVKCCFFCPATEAIYIYQYTGNIYQNIGNIYPEEGLFRRAANFPALWPLLLPCA